ncbi:MAG: geranylgeranyl diphosphate reductase [Gemmatimonadota bacterium]|nr:geranylgeranyl diphosphate reductase [Gemmatimonadota bacterium]
MTATPWPDRGTRRVDAVVVGGGPAGATAAHTLATAGVSTMLLDKAGRIKPCGGAIPPRLIDDFAIPDHLLVAKVATARMVSPGRQRVDIPVGRDFVGMVDRGVFDEWLRVRATEAGAERVTGMFERFERRRDGGVDVTYRAGGSRQGESVTVTARYLIGADGALSAVARQAIPVAYRGTPRVTAYHEVIRSPAGDSEGYQARRADVYYDGRLSPDFYAWIFPHGPEASVGTGSLRAGFDVRAAVAALRREAGLENCETIRREGAPIPLRPLDWWDDARNVVVAGDAAGVVAPASGEGIFYAMTSGRCAAEAVQQALRTGKASKLAWARRRFMLAHGLVFGVLGVMQDTWYGNDDRRERFVTLCRDTDIQRLAFDGYTRKRLVFAKPLAHARIFLKNLGHLSGVLAPT